MADHVMGPSDIEGFAEQCIYCGALDTEIRFQQGHHCPARDLNHGYEQPALPLHKKLEPHALAHKQFVANLQANWLMGYSARQLFRSVND